MPDAIHHLRKTYPRQTSDLTDDDLRARLLSAAQRSASYALTTEDHVLCFASTALLLGDQFDTDPQHTWAAGILNDAELSANERAAMLVAIAELLIEEQTQETSHAQPS